MAYVVETYTECEGWVACWSEGGNSLTFGTKEEARAEIDELLEDVRVAVAAGDMDEEYSPDDYRITEVG